MQAQSDLRTAIGDPAQHEQLLWRNRWSAHKAVLLSSHILYSTPEANASCSGVTQWQGTLLWGWLTFMTP